MDATRPFITFIEGIAICSLNIVFIIAVIRSRTMITKTILVMQVNIFSHNFVIRNLIIRISILNLIVT